LGVGALVFILVVLLGACGDDGGAGDADASMLPDGSTAPGEVEMPGPPAPPALAPCPMGWTESTVGDLAFCDPRPGETPCIGDTARFVGEEACASVGSACPSGDFPEGLPTGVEVVYVLAGAGPGDGSEASPFPTLTEALAAAPARAIIAVGRGTYDEELDFPKSLTLWGACVAETVLTTSAPSDDRGTILLAAPNEVTVTNLSIRDSERVGVWSRGEGRVVRLDDVLIEGTRAAGIVVNTDGALFAENLIVRNTRSTATGDIGQGLNLESGTAEVARAVFANNREMGVKAFASSLRLERVSIEETQPRERDGNLGRGLSAQRGAMVEVYESLFSNNHESGVVAANDGTELTLEQVVIRGTRSSASGEDGHGITAGFGARISARRVDVVDNEQAGVIVSASGNLDLEDVVVRETRRRASDDRFGRGIELSGGATAEADRVVVVDNRDLGVFVAEAGTSLNARDLVISRTQIDLGAGRGGHGLQITTGATVTLVRALLRESSEVAIIVAGTGSRLDAEDLSILDTLADDEGQLGRGVQLQEGAAGDLTRVLVARSHELGIGTYGAGTSLTLAHLSLVDTRARACAETSCTDDVAGIGLGAYEAATLDVTTFRITRAHLCGVQLATDGEIDLHDGEVTENRIGVCIQNDGYDTRRLSDRVHYDDNESNLMTTNLPVPEAAPRSGD